MSAECRRLRGPHDTGPACSCEQACALGIPERRDVGPQERARLTAVALVEASGVEVPGETDADAALNEHLTVLAREYLTLLQQRAAGSWGPRMPDDCIENGRVLVIQYVRPDGGMGRYVGTKGDLPISMFVGLLHIGAFQLMYEAARLEEDG